jgi:NAD(P)-dependent dehydrogenase (short-subunit alcohol dehydrogenase family)
MSEFSAELVAGKADLGVALVTGASTGIGRATAKALKDAGFRVFGTSRRAVSEKPDGITMLIGDVTDDASVAKLVDEVISDAGRIDLLVNNAGVENSIRPGCGVLQSSANALGIRERCAPASSSPTLWRHRRHSDPGWSAPPPDMIFGKDRYVMTTTKREGVGFVRFRQSCGPSRRSARG